MKCYETRLQCALAGEWYAFSEYRELEYSVGDYFSPAALQASLTISRRSDLRAFQPRSVWIALLSASSSCGSAAGGMCCRATGRPVTCSTMLMTSRTRVGRPLPML